MLKNIKKYSVVALATLVLIGCGADDKNESTTKDLSTYSDAEKLAYALVNQKKALNAGQSDEKQNKALDSEQSDVKQSRKVQECQNGGSMDFGDFDPSNYMEYYTPPTITFKNCNDGDSTINGKIKMDLYSDEEGTISYLTDFSFKDSEGSGLIKQGGRVEFHNEGGWEVATINMVAVFNGVTHGGENLIYRSKEFSDGSILEYPVSGKEKIGDSTYFTVDPNYDASVTPFKSNANYELLSGLFKYLDKNNNAVELQITSKDVVTVRVDENGDGTFSDSEKSTIDLAQ